MPPFLPPLTALRAFESCARHLSISRAAEELHLTHGAVSHQIKNLEEQLAVRLIARKGRGIVLTPTGQSFAGTLREALAQLVRVVEDVRPARAGVALHISVLPSFAARWLVPRLARFNAICPGIEVHLHTTPALADFGRGDCDLAIRYGAGTWPGAAAEKVMGEAIIPVCSPDFNGGQLPGTPAQILAHPLLRDTHVRWSAWFDEMGQNVTEPKNTFVYNDSGLLVQAAVAGQGIGLVRAVLAHDDLCAGRLIRLPGAALPANAAYHAVFAADTPLSANAQAFLTWIKAEAEEAFGTQP